MHTQEEWQLSAKNEADGEYLIFAGGSADEPDVFICTVYGGLGHCFEDNRCYESDANARLIRAAPELLAACERLLRAEEWSVTADRMDFNERCALLKRAIEKATT